MRPTIPALLSLLAFAGPALSAEADDGAVQAAVISETHATSNALDAPLARSDVYQLLRGALSRRWTDDLGTTALAVEAQATRYRRTTIEDDRSGAISLTRHVRLDRFELKGTLAAIAASEGDDLIVGPLVIGTRTDKAVVKLSGEAGADLGAGFAAILTASLSSENAGKTYFEDDLIAPARLDADATRSSVTVGLRRTLGPWTAVATVALHRTAYELLGNPPLSVSSGGQSLKAELRWSRYGFALGAGLGMARLAADNGLYDRWRPVWELAALLPLGRSSATLKAAGHAAFETDDTDDPMASFVTRGELELASPLSRRTRAGIGVYAQRVENLLLENEERAFGVYGELGFAPSPRYELVLRADWRDEFVTVYDERSTTFDTMLRLGVKL